MARGWPPVRRTFTDFKAPIFDPYALAIGRIALVWNELHERLAFVFSSVLQDVPMARSFAIWNSSNFDRGRRQILKDATTILSDTELATYPLIAEEIKWLCDRSENFENIRNDAIHSPLLSGILLDEDDNKGPYPQVFPNTLSQNKRASRLYGKELLLEFEWCYDSIIILRDYAGNLYLAMLDEPFPWPDRPELPNRPNHSHSPSGQRKRTVRHRE